MFHFGRCNNKSLSEENVSSNEYEGDQDPKELGYRLIRIRSLFIEAGVATDESDLIDQAMIALPGHDCVDVMTAAHRNAEMSGEHT